METRYETQSDANYSHETQGDANYCYETQGDPNYSYEVSMWKFWAEIPRLDYS